MATTQGPVVRSIVRLHQVVNGLRMVLAADRLAGALKQAAKLIERRMANLDLVGYSPQESVVRKVTRLEIRREDNQLLEWHLNLLPRGQGQKVVPVFQRYDPSVEQIRSLDALAPEVVDQQTAAVALHLQRGFADIRCRIVANLESVERQFAANDDRRPPNFDPSRIVVG